MMKVDHPSTRWIEGWPRSTLFFFSILLLSAIACSLQLQPPTPVVITVVVPAATTTALQAQPSPTSTPLGPTATAGPSCKVQQGVNLRSGPGTAYDPPITSLKTDTELIPTGYNPEGVPGGAWVQVEVKGQNQKGWVSAGSQFVSCNIELASLPPVAVAPPPKPPRPVVSAGAPDGNNIELFRASFDFNPDYFLHMYVFYSEDPNEKFKTKKDGRDIDSVEFIVTSANGDVTYFDRTENNPGYCIFGGGDPDCSPWIVEGGQYKWSAGGEPVKAGKYGLTINVTASNGEVGTWIWNNNSHNPITIDVP